MKGAGEESIGKMNGAVRRRRAGGSGIESLNFPGCLEANQCCINKQTAAKTCHRQRTSEKWELNMYKMRRLKANAPELPIGSNIFCLHTDLILPACL